VWQAIYADKKDRGFVVVAIAFDSAGVPAVKDFIRPPELSQFMFDFMGWDRSLSSRAATPAYPCLIDQKHLVASLYNMVNVPTAVWIDEGGRIVRPPEPAGASDVFRHMNPQTFEVPAAAAADGKRRKQIYVDAVLDWIDQGAQSRHALAPEEVRRRMRGLSETESRAGAHFRLGVWLAKQGRLDPARGHLDEAVKLRPESWSFRRQSIVLGDPALTGQFAATPEYWQAVMSLGDRFYYPPIEMDGMPPPFARPEAPGA
jgi:hypothetical protein